MSDRAEEAFQDLEETVKDCAQQLEGLRKEIGSLNQGVEDFADKQMKPKAFVGVVERELRPPVRELGSALREVAKISRALEAEKGKNKSLRRWIGVFVALSVGVVLGPVVNYFWSNTTCAVFGWFTSLTASQCEDLGGQQTTYSERPVPLR